MLSLFRTLLLQILNGKTITSLDHNKSLKECKVANYCKIMVLGKKYDPESDEMYAKVKEIESKSFDIDLKLAEVAKELKDLEDGFVAKEHHSQAIKGLKRRCGGCTEEYMRLLESLDGLRFEESQADAKSKRKSVAKKINGNLDNNEGLLTRIEAFEEQIKS